jgi:hypothetical protein
MMGVAKATERIPSSPTLVLGWGTHATVEDLVVLNGDYQVF